LTSSGNVFDPAYCNWMHINWHDTEWKDFYLDAAEPMLLHQNQGERECRSTFIVMQPMKYIWL